MNAITNVIAAAVPASRILAVVIAGELDQGAIEQLRDAIDSPETTVVFARPQVGAIAALVAQLTEVPGAIITGPSKEPSAVRSRFAVYWVATQFGRSPTAIGRTLGDRAWGTVKYGVAKAAELRASDADFRALTDKVISHFNTGGIA